MIQTFYTDLHNCSVILNAALFNGLRADGCVPSTVIAGQYCLLSKKFAQAGLHARPCRMLSKPSSSTSATVSTGLHALAYQHACLFGEVVRGWEMDYWCRCIPEVIYLKFHLACKSCWFVLGFWKSAEKLDDSILGQPQWREVSEHSTWQRRVSAAGGFCSWGCPPSLKVRKDADTCAENF